MNNYNTFIQVKIWSRCYGHDKQGIDFAVATEEDIIKLFDSHSYSKVELFFFSES
jgi:hypothetical protein